jgi:hypothetical protein
MRMILLFMLFLPTESRARIEVPEILKGGKIVVTTKDGKKHYFDSNDFAIVDRNSGNKRQESICDPCEECPDFFEPKIIVETHTEYKEVWKPHHIKFFAGMNAGSYRIGKENRSEVVLKKEPEIGFGFSYDYRLTKSLSIGGAVFTDHASYGSLGLLF